MPLPLKLGPLGLLREIKGSLFDDKLPTQEEYKFNGSRGGENWRGKVGRYFISKVPAVKAIFEWAESVDMNELECISDAMIEQALGVNQANTLMDEERMLILNSAIWGFLSGCVSGEAETIFKGSPQLNGIDAWRRPVRFVDHGRSIRLETLRSEVRRIPLKPIKNLESVDVGIAEFENKILVHPRRRTMI